MSKVTLTTPRQAVVAVLAGAVLMWGGLAIYDRLSTYPPVVPWTVPVALGVVSVAGIIYALCIPKRLEERKLGSREAMVALITGKAMVLSGAALAGANTVYVMKFVSAIEAETPLQRVIHGGGTLAASVLLAVAGSMIEHRLRIQQPPDEKDAHHADATVA
ncbi:DUF3180 family protein [uncultured Tessaracoccus sp.]|uniref:DUF3180 family protein n=1 Tax=uncultured Tessaracoccus sp. TaxID=905023 RepID=UPI00262A9075|nr:DUF3180 family protein [uncultured Tessaracoccus sp.]